MAGNEWINGYLEAILDAGSGINAREFKSPVPQQKQHLSSNHFNPTKYFVDEVVSAYDETDLHKTWMKVFKSFPIIFIMTSFPYIVAVFSKGKNIVQCSVNMCFLV